MSKEELKIFIRIMENQKVILAAYTPDVWYQKECNLAISNTTAILDEIEKMETKDNE